MKACPNTSLPEWNKLVNEVGEMEAYRDFYESGTIRSVDEVLTKIQSRTQSEIEEVGPISFLQKQLIAFNKLTGDAMASNLLSTLSRNVGKDYSLVTINEAEEILTEADVEYNGEAGFYHNGKAYLVKGKFNAETAFHEFSHPIVDAIAIENATLFDKLYSEASAIPGIVDTVESLYTSADELTKKKEVIVRAITQSANMDTNKSFLNKVMYAIKQLFRKLFGKSVNVKDLNANTTLAEMAKMIQTTEFKYEFVENTSDSTVQFLKDEAQWREAVANTDANEIAAKIGELKNIAAISKKLVEANPELKNAIKDDKTSRDLVEQLLADLGKAERITPDMKAKDVLETIFKVNLSVLYQGIKDAQRLVASLENYSIDIKGDATQEQLTEIMAVSKIAENLAIWADHMILFATERKVSSDNALIQELNEIKNKAAIVENHIYDSLLELATDFVYNNLSKNLIKDGETRWNENMARAKATNNKARIEALERDKAKYFITREDIKARLQGQIKDAPMASTVEAFVRSSDPVVQSFAKWHLMNVSKVEVQSQKFINDMFNELFDEAVKVGYKPGQEQGFWEDLVFLDKSFRPKEVNPNSSSTKDKMSVEEHQVYTFLTPYKDHRWFFKELNERIGLAVQEGNEEEYHTLMAKKRLYSKFMHSIKNPQARAADEVFETAEYGEQAYAAKEQALAKIKYIDARISIIDASAEDAELFAEKEQAMKEYQNLFRITNLDGTKKSKEDQEIAKVLKSYREATQGLYVYEELPGIFEMEYEHYIDSLYESGLDPQSQEFKDLRQKWIEDNTEISLTEAHKKRESEIYDRLKQISTRLSSPELIAIDKLYEELRDLTSGFRDNNLQIEAHELDPKVQLRIKQIEEEIEKLRSRQITSSGFTRAEQEYLNEMADKRDAGTITTEEKAEVSRIFKSRVKDNEIKALLAEQKTLLAELRGLKNKEFSEYYLEVWQEHLDRIKEEGESNSAYAIFKTGIIADSSAFDQITASEIERINNSTDLKTLLQDKLFRSWWEANHRSTSKYVMSAESGDWSMETTVNPTGIWEVKKPKDKFLQSIKLSGEIYYRTPKTIKYKKRVLAEPTERIPGVTVSYANENDWLPNVSLKEITTKDGTVIRNPFINDAYYELQRANPAKFKFLEKVKAFHIKSQEGLSSAGKLNFDVPRFERQTYDKISNLANDGYRAFLKEQGKDIVQSFIGNAKQKFEQGLNYEAKLLVNEGLVGDELNKIPIHGVSKMDNELVNLNLFRSMALYGTSGLMQKMLIETSPTAQALLKVLENPQGALADGMRIKKNAAVSFGQQMAVRTGSPTRGSNTLRESLIRSLYERDWLGQRYADTLLDRSAPKTMETVKKVGSAMSKVAANSYFAFNISSALKNRFTAVLQNLIEAAAGEFINFRSLKKGKILAAKATTEISSNIFHRGPKSKNIQIAQIFDINGQLAKTADPMYRTLGRDAASLSWALSARQLGELNASLELLFAMLDFQKVSLKDGTQISLYDALVIKDGQLTMRDDVTEEWAYNSDNFNDFKIKFQGVFDRLQGNYKDINQPMADRYFLFKQVNFMRKFFMSMFMRRFARERPQSDINRFEEGYYISSFGYLRDTIMYYMMGDRSADGTAIMKPSAKEKAALKRLGIDVATQLVLSLLIKYMLLFLFDYDEDDPEKKSKSAIRNATGALKIPGLGIADDGKDFNPIAYAELHAINQMMQVMIESATFNPHSFSNYGNLYLTGSGIYKQPFSSFGASFGRLYKMGTNMTDYLMGNSTGYYTRRVGPTWYQQKYQPKVTNEMYKFFGLEAVTKDLSAADRLESTMSQISMMKR